MEYFNNKNLTKIGEGSFGTVYTNGRYAYKFVVSSDKMKLMREMRMFRRASKIGVAPPIPPGQKMSLKSIGNGEYVLRIVMKRLDGNVMKYAKIVGGNQAYSEIANLTSQLHLGGICHGDLYELDNIVHDGKRLYITDFSESTVFNNKRCMDQNALSSLQQKLSKVLISASSPKSKRRRGGLFGSPGSNMGSPNTPRRGSPPSAPVKSRAKRRI